MGCIWGQLYCIPASEKFMYNKQQLKPLNHKKLSPNVQPTPKTPITKEPAKAEIKQTVQTTKPTGLTKKPSNGETAKPAKYERSAQRSSKTIEHYECDDFGL